MIKLHNFIFSSCTHAETERTISNRYTKSIIIARSVGWYAGTITGHGCDRSGKTGYGKHCTATNSTTKTPGGERGVAETARRAEQTGRRHTGEYHQLYLSFSMFLHVQHAQTEKYCKINILCSGLIFTQVPSRNFNLWIYLLLPSDLNKFKTNQKCPQLHLHKIWILMNFIDFTVNILAHYVEKVESAALSDNVPSVSCMLIYKAYSLLYMSMLMLENVCCKYRKMYLLKC